MRILTGALFVGHGTQKLFGWFGGHGPEGTSQFFESIGLRPGKHNAIAAGAAEAGGGALLATGVGGGLAMPELPARLAEPEPTERVVEVAEQPETAETRVSTSV